MAKASGRWLGSSVVEEVATHTDERFDSAPQPYIQSLLHDYTDGMRHAREDYNRIQDPDGEIPEDEPVFLLRGKDLAAPDAIREWARQASKRGADTEIVSGAMEWARVMEEYQADTGTHSIPDL